jgi:hypothetical protein
MMGGAPHESTVDTIAGAVRAVDVDGALQETAACAISSSRTTFLRRALGVLAGVGIGLDAASDGRASAASAASANDVAMLRFDLVLEYLQSGLYTEAERLGELTPKTLAWARVVGAHERAHVQAIKNLLGRKVVPSPTFNYRGVTSDEQAFIKTAVAFEDLTAALLKWQAVRLDSRSILAAVVTLHSVETRHAAWIRYLNGLRPAASAFDKPASQTKMAHLIAKTRFVASRPQMVRSDQPRFTG